VRPVEGEVGGQPVEPHGDARGPVERLVVDRPGDRVGRGVGEVEELADLGLLGGDLHVRHLCDARAEVVDLQHLDVRAKLRVDGGEVRVHVEHARIGVAHEADPRAAQGAGHARRADPGGDLLPGPLVAVDRAGDGVVGDPRAGERAGQLGHAAGRAVGQPFAGVGVLVVERRRGLEPEQHHRHLGRLHGREHLAGGRVRDGVAEHEVDPRAREAVARLARPLGRVHQSGRHHLAAELAYPLLDAALVGLDALAQAVELRPVRRKPDSEDADASAHRLRSRSRRCSRR